ncbi:MAG: SDR family oxidoreductase [Clostridia bacterium]|nr:SDR family oxidoreductase [Clostridia bacterium]
MSALLIGGTGTISTAVTALLLSKGWKVCILNRGSHNGDVPEGVEVLTADIRDDAAVRSVLGSRTFDVVCDFVAYVPDHVRQDIALFTGRCGQYIYISSASAYHKVARNYVITEGTSMVNPFWQYSRDKIACEAILMEAYAKDGFPVTIVRPSHTYGDRSLPVAVHGNGGYWQVVRRILDDKPIIIHGDGTSLWTVTHASDFAKGFVGLMGNTKTLGEAFHITSDESLPWNEIMREIAEALGKELHAFHVPSDFLAATSNYDFNGSLSGDKAVSVVFDNSKIKRFAPEFVCTTPFYLGARQTLDYVLSHPELQVPDPEFDRYTDRLIEGFGALKRSFID